MDRRAAEVIAAEVGTDMGSFSTVGHRRRGPRCAPGNNESAGKRRTGKTTRGSRWLRTTLVQCAWAASHTKGTYRAAQYRRLAARRGKKRTLVAVGHTILAVAYHLLKHETTCQEAGGDFFERLDLERLTRSLVRRLEKLGHDVTLSPRETAA